MPYERRPYETHVLTFNEVTACAVRVIGRPGGLAEFTSLARLAVYCRDLSRWNPVLIPPPPVPYIFRLISPLTIWDLSESLVKLMGMSISIPYLDHYLDKDRYEQWWRQISRNYQGEPELWFVVGGAIGWDVWSRLEVSGPDVPPASPRTPYVRMGFHNTLARAVAPIIVDEQILGELSSHPVIVKGAFDPKWHRRYARDHGMEWEKYQAAAARSPQMTLEQLDGAATLMGMIANTMANLAHRNLGLERELDGARRSVDQRVQQRREIVRQAIDFMQAKRASQNGG